MTSLADVMSNLQDPEATLATARQWTSERVSDCHGASVWLDGGSRVFRCGECFRACEPVLPAEKETTVTDDWREKHSDLDCLRRQVMSLPVAPTVVRYIEQIEVERDELRDKLDGMVSADWHGPTAILDTLYLTDVFIEESDDLGARIVVLARKLAEVTQRAEKAEAAARDFGAQLHALADLHHRTTRPSELHGPDRQPDYRECGCKTCCSASRAFERHPEYAPERKESHDRS